LVVCYAVSPTRIISAYNKYLFEFVLKNKVCMLLSSWLVQYVILVLFVGSLKEVKNVIEH
jgi:hypothetical protein